jgi:Cof subfamily protein (haloacid dehalogenase superfamily)
MTTGSGIRLVVCDLDGTLLASSGAVSGRTRAAVNGIREKGILFSFCSGRIHTMLDVYVRILGLTTPVITANGAVIFDPCSRRPVTSVTVPYGQTQLWYRFCSGHAVDFSVLCFEGCWFTENSTRIERFRQYNEIACRERQAVIPLHALNDCGVLKDKTVVKLLAYAKDGAEFDLLRKFSLQTEGVACTSSMPRLLDISPGGVSKGSGLAELIRFLGLQKEQVCVFGDYINDLSLFEQAGLRVAMGNACGELKMKSDYVCDTNDRDGVARFMESYFLSGRGCA